MSNEGCPSCGKWWGIGLMFLIAASIVGVAVMIHDSVSMKAMDNLTMRCNEQIKECNKIVDKYNVCAQYNGMEQSWPNLTMFNISAEDT